MKVEKSHLSHKTSIEYRVSRKSPSAITLLSYTTRNGFTPLETIGKQQKTLVSLTGFTLVELMLAVSILSVGIVLVVHSFLSVVTVLDSSRNRIQALQLLETKMADLETKVREEGGILPESKQEEVKINNRDAVLKLEIVPLKVKELEPEEEELEEDKEVINEVMLSLSWQEGNRDKDAILSTYLKAKPKEAE